VDLELVLRLVMSAGSVEDVATGQTSVGAEEIQETEETEEIEEIEEADAEATQETVVDLEILRLTADHKEGLAEVILRKMNEEKADASFVSSVDTSKRIVQSVEEEAEETQETVIKEIEDRTAVVETDPLVDSIQEVVVDHHPGGQEAINMIAHPKTTAEEMTALLVTIGETTAHVTVVTTVHVIGAHLPVAMIATAVEVHLTIISEGMGLLD